MSQQNIDFGSFPDDPNADAIRTAFDKVQQNFDELYAASTVGSVTSVNRGAGITVNSPTGNVVVTANIACVSISTSSLSIGRDGNGGTSANITSSSQTLVIDINPANVFSANFAANSTGALANFNGTLTSASNSQPNITSVGTLTNLAVTGNITASNVYANTGTIGATTLIGTLNANSNSQPNITTIGTLGNLNVTTNSNLGNLATANFFSGDGYLLSNLPISAGSSITNGNSNVIVTANGNVTTSVAGTANIVVVSSTGVNIAGSLTAGNANLGNLVSANYFSGNGSLLTGVISGTATTAVTVTASAQPNITSVGTLSSLSVSGTSNLGAVGNITITGGTSGYFLQTNGSGTLSWTNAALVAVPGNTAEVIFNDSGNYAANTNLTFNKTTGLLTATLLGGTLTTAAQPNITSLGALSTITINGPTIANGTFNTGNANANIITANYYIGNGSNLASITGANVSGAVAYATTANAVAGANVSGAVASATTAGTVTTAAQPNITSVGTLTSLTLTPTTGTLTVPIITTGANTTAGTITGNWSLSAGSQLRATYADLAEYYAGDANIEPGTVVQFGGDKEVQICNTHMSRLVAGIVTTNPAYVMNTDINCEYPIAVALQGRIPAKVIGPVTRGDMMVSANNGYAISCNSPAMGTVLGKALTDFNGETGIIEIMVGRT